MSSRNGIWGNKGENGGQIGKKEDVVWAWEMRLGDVCWVEQTHQNATSTYLNFLIFQQKRV